MPYRFFRNPITAAYDYRALSSRTVKNSTVKSNVTTDVIQQNSWDYYDNNKWGSGNEVPVAAVVVGNRGAEGAISYPYDATLTSINSSFIIANKLPVYAAVHG